MSSRYSASSPATCNVHVPPSDRASPLTTILAPVGVYPMRLTASRMSPSGTALPAFNSSTATESERRKLADSPPLIFLRLRGADSAQEAQSRPVTDCSTCKYSPQTGTAARIRTSGGFGKLAPPLPL